MNFLLFLLRFAHLFLTLCIILLLILSALFLFFFLPLLNSHFYFLPIYSLFCPTTNPLFTLLNFIQFLILTLIQIISIDPIFLSMNPRQIRSMDTPLIFVRSMLTTEISVTIKDEFRHILQMFRYSCCRSVRVRALEI